MRRGKSFGKGRKRAGGKAVGKGQGLVDGAVGVGPGMSEQQANLGFPLMGLGQLGQLGHPEVLQTLQRAISM